MNKKGWSRERCERYIAGGIWGSEYESMVSPTVGDGHIPSTSKQISVKTKQPLFKMENVPIFQTGNWKGIEWTEQDLDEIVKNTNELIENKLHEPPVKLGHDEGQEISGMPAVGWVKKLKKIGNQIFADIVDIPKKVFEAIQKRAYRKVSAEIYTDFENPKTKQSIGKTLRAIALLGADVPEVKGLGDILTLYNQDINSCVITFEEKELKEAEQVMKNTKQFDETNLANRILTLAEVDNICKTCGDFLRSKRLKEVKYSTFVEMFALRKNPEMLEKIIMKLQDENGAPRCPEGFVWDEKQGKCVPENKTDEKSKESSEQKTKPEKNDKEKKLIEKYGDEKFKQLKELLGDDIYKLLEQEKTCLEGMKWDEAQQKCVPIEQEKENPIKKVVDKEPDDWTEDELNQLNTLFKKESTPEQLAEIEKFPDDKRPPKGWFDRCVRSVSNVTDTPEQLCGWVYYRWMTPERKSKIEATRQTEEEIKKLQEQLKKVKGEKIKQFIEQHKSLITPAIESEFKQLAETLESNKTIKFDEKETNMFDLLLDFIDKLYKQKLVLFDELVKQNEEKFIQDIKNKVVTKFTDDEKKGIEIRNIDTAIEIQRIAEEEGISYRDAYLKYGERMKNQKLGGE